MLLRAACITLETPLQPLKAFYQSQLVLALLAGLALIALPAVIVEAPEPSYTAETLLRRSSGVGAGVAGATAVWSLLGAAGRGRLGASTFVQLNGTMGIVNIAVRPLPGVTWTGRKAGVYMPSVCHQTAFCINMVIEC